MIIAKVGGKSMTFLVNMFLVKVTHPILLLVPPCLFTKPRVGEAPLH